MKEQADLVRGLLRKARSDLCAMDASFQAGAFDASCFHAQQAVEKYLKTYLTHAEIPFPFSHNLAKLLDLCMAAQPSFGVTVSLGVAERTAEMKSFDDLLRASDCALYAAKNAGRNTVRLAGTESCTAVNAQGNPALSPSSLCPSVPPEADFASLSPPSLRRFFSRSSTAAVPLRASLPRSLALAALVWTFGRLDVWTFTFAVFRYVTPLTSLQHLGIMPPVRGCLREVSDP